MGDGGGVGQRQITRVEDARLGAEGLEQARGLLSEEAAEGALSQRAIEQKDARLVRGRLGAGEAIRRRDVEVRCRHVRQVAQDVAGQTHTS